MTTYKELADYGVPEDLASFQAIAQRIEDDFRKRLIDEENHGELLEDLVADFELLGQTPSVVRPIHRH